MTWLLPGLVAASLLVGSHLLAFPAQWRERPGLLPAPALTLTMLSLLLWVLPVEGALPSIQWIPSLDPAALSPTGTGAWLVPLALLSLAGGISLNTRGAPRDTGLASRAVRWWGLAYCGCGLTIAALTVDQFLVRVVLLDLVALATVFLLHTAKQPLDRQALIRDYLVFRVGDMALLAAVLLLWRDAGTMSIDSMISIGAGYPAPHRLVVVLLGALAAYIKLGLPPFGGWLSAMAQEDGARRLFVGGAMLPLLGAYLLYRLHPMAQGALLRGCTVAMGLVPLVWRLLQLRTLGPSSQGPWGLWSTAHGSLGLVLLSTGAIRWYVLSFLPIRIALSLCYYAPSQNPIVAARLAATMAGAGRALFARPWRLLLRAAGLLAQTLRQLMANAKIVVARGRVCPQVFLNWLQAMHSGSLRRYALWILLVLGVFVGLAAIMPLVGKV